MLTMVYKCFIVALLFSLNLGPALVAAEPHRAHLHFHRNRKLSTLSDNPIIEKACQGLGSFEQECLSVLNSAPDHQKADVNGLAFFTLRYIETNATNLTNSFKDFAEEANLPPLLQDALKDCVDQYIPFDDLIEDAINAVLENAYPDAEKFINAAITNVDNCDDEFKQDHLQEETEEKSADDFQKASGLREINMGLRYHLSAALNIIKAHN